MVERRKRKNLLPPRCLVTWTTNFEHNDIKIRIALLKTYHLYCTSLELFCILNTAWNAIKLCLKV